ncbi:carboxymuconolactone decarboxylase family protein [Sphingomonas gilva]|uniref:Carboxymuconolactone decarboxylase family protein n=1 Tax=Sphingomonas gilva TaxID=2305907 RepID=A0A396RV21_9SPHN|nr:carboxymuconolactone decarboxylase family protein [Sphingomonas gilva]RHW19242.1 carboxymuconolactone decarboxylase family protein [Sphingomonas gilva]
MARITLYENLADPTPEQRAIHQAILDGPRGKLVGPLRAVLRVPALAGPWQEIGAHLRYRTALTPRQSELVIVTVARHWSSELEWQIHAREAAATGIDERVITAIRDRSPPPFGDALEADLHDFTATLLARGDVADALHARITAAIGEPAMVELVALIGYYSMVALMLNAQAILPPDGARPLAESDRR